MKRVALIINPIAGRGRGQRAGAQARTQLEQVGVEVRVHLTSRGGEARDLAAEISRKTDDAVVAVGGDGTLREIVEGLDPASPHPVGLIPVGTANVVARELKIPLCPKRAARLVIEGRERPLDVGRVNDRVFLAMVGIGFDSEVVRRVATKRERSGSISRLSYLGPSVRTFFSHRPSPIRVSVEGGDAEQPGYGLVVCNTRNYAGHFVITPNADPSDGLLDFMLQRGKGTWSLLRLFVAACTRRHSSRRVASYGKGRTLLVEASHDMSFQADGDWLGESRRLHIGLAAHPIRILAPSSPGSGTHP